MTGVEWTSYGPARAICGAGMEAVSQGQKLFNIRLVIGLAQGLALYLLYSAYDAKAWPATQGLIFAPLLIVFLAIPTLLISALGEMPLRKALAWAGIALIAIAILAFFDNWTAWPLDWAYVAGAPRPHVIPSPQLFVFGGAGLFIAHALVTAPISIIACGRVIPPISMSPGRWRCSWP